MVDKRSSVYAVSSTSGRRSRAESVNSQASTGSIHRRSFVSFRSRKSVSSVVVLSSDNSNSIPSRKVSKISNPEDADNGMTPRRKSQDMMSAAGDSRKKSWASFNNRRRSSLKSTEFQPSTNTIQYCFNEWASSELPAVEDYNGTKVSYKVFNTRCNQLAHFLRDEGVCMEDRIGITCSRNIKMITCILGAVKAGAAYVPLDTKLNQDRYKYIISDASPKFVLVERKYQHLVPETAQKLIIEDVFKNLSAFPSYEPIVAVQPTSFLCLIYTSGSTGEPKGVMITHRSLVRIAKQPELCYGEGKKVSMASNFGFDASMQEVWGALLNGACLCTIDYEALLDPVMFAEFVTKKQITSLFLPTALLESYAAADAAMFKNLDCVIAGGDVFSPQLARNLLHCPEGHPKNIINGYGPSENGCGTTIYVINDTKQDQGSVPIGKPVNGTDVYLFDENMRRITTPNTPGEILCGGIGLARGYFNKPEMTREKFITNPLTNVPGDILYRTGDRAQIRHDGNYEFLGRIDNQVKIRGFRIEPAEVESCMCTHPSIDKVCVVPYTTGSGGVGDKHLAIYYTVNKGSKITLQEYKAFAANAVPHYMVPEAFVPVKSFPLTTNGKIDRRKLPDPVSAPKANFELKRGGYFNADTFDLEGTMISDFLKHVSEVPDVVCVEMPTGEVFTYEQVDLKANRLANYLLTNGVECGSFVGVVCQRDFATILAMVAIVKAGCAYVPIDTSIPASRRDYILADTNPHFVFCSRGMRHLLEGKFNILTLESLDKELEADYSELPPNVRISDKSCFAIVYTSGSTGTPKGVSLTHAGICRLCKDEVIMKVRERKENCLAYANFGFDACLLEIWVSLCTGNRIVFPTQEVALNPDKLEKFIKDKKITRMFVTVALFDKLAILKPGMFKSLYWLGVGGDALSPSTIHKVASCPEGRPTCFANVYGPTENGVISTGYLIDHVDPNDSGVPIGKPLYGTTAYVFDSEMQLLTGVGQKGQLFLGGSGLANGYHGLPEKTSKVFISNPLNPSAEDSVLYATGDHVTILEDGGYMFSGRVDNQVKIRGFRIELGELEGTALKHPSVDLACCVVFQSGTTSGDKTLAMYYVSKRGCSISEVKLAAFMEETLPKFMMPSYFMRLDEFPLTANGKVDKRSLPDPTKRAACGGVVAASTLCEQQLGEILAEVLQIDEGDISFDCSVTMNGGNSLSALGISARIRSLLNVDVSITNILESASLKELASLINASSVRTSDTSLNLIKASKQEYYPVTNAMQRLFLFNQMTKEPVYNCAFKVNLLGTIDYQILSSALVAVINKHIVFRTTLEEVDGVPMQKVAEKIDVPLEVLDFRAFKNSERLQALHEVQEELETIEFDLSRGPMVVLKLVELPGRKATLYACMHHIIFDGWSFSVFMDDLTETYRLCARGESLPVADPNEIDYIDYCVASSNQGHSDEYKEFWTNELKDVRHVSIPTDYPKKKIPTYQGETVKCIFGPDLRNKIEAESNRTGSTMFSYLLAVYKLMLYKYTRSTDIVVGSPLANRTQKETERMIGYFTNMLPYRTQLDPEEKFESFVQKVTRNARKIYDHQDTPINQVWDCLPKTNKNASLFQSVFILQNGVDLSGELTRGLYWSANVVSPKVARFDVSFTVFLFGNNEIEFRLEYNSDLFNEDTIERIKDNYLFLLNSCLEAPEESLAKQSMLCQNQRNQISKFTMANTSLPRAPTINDKLGEVAAFKPKAVAIMDMDSTLTFEDLDNQSSKLSSCLSAKGVTSGSVVIVQGIEGVANVVSMFAISRLGAIFALTKDEAASNVIRSSMPDSLSTSLLISESNVAQLMSEAEACATDSVIWACDPEANVALMIHEGVPVMYSHKNIFLASQISSQLQTLSPNTNVHASITQQCTSVCTSVYLLEVFAAVLSGNSVCFPDDLNDSHDVQHFFDAFHVTTATIVPRLASRLLDELPEVFESLNTLYLPYEQAGVSSVFELYNDFSAYMPLHVYSIFCAPMIGSWLTVHELSEEDVESSQIPLGTPICGNACFVLDQTNDYSPIGIPGSFYAIGNGVSDSLNSSTVEVNSAVAVRVDTECVWSETGVLYAHWDTMKNSNKASQRDLMLMTSALRRHYDISEGITLQCSTSSPESDSSEKRTVAYYSTRSGHDIDEGELRSYMINTLPSNLVPAIFMHIGQFAMNGNGGIDTTFLPSPAVTNEVVKSELEIALIDIWAKILDISVATVNINASFFDLGGHSISLARMLSEVKKVFGVHIALSAFNESPFIGFLTKAIGAEGQSVAGAEIDEQRVRDDTVIPDYIVPVHGPKANVDNPNSVLLTGATGFLGVFLLDQLLNETDAKVYCLVRASDIAVAWKRLSEHASTYKVKSINPDNQRLEIILGNLSDRNLGLSPHDYLRVCEEVDVIYHCGALVHHLYGYNHLREANVLSTREILEIACTHKNKGVYFISTSGVVTEKDPFTGLLIEDYTERIPTSGGYAQTKWASEWLIKNASKKGIHAATFRAGNITGHSETGISNASSNHMMLVVKGCMQMNAFPEWARQQLEMTPVDVLAKAMVRLSQKYESSGKMFNMTNPTTISWKEYIGILASCKTGFTPKFVPELEWQTSYVNNMEESNAMFSLAILYGSPGDEEEATNASRGDAEEMEEMETTLETEETQRALNACGIRYPNDYAALLKQYGKRMIESGFWADINTQKGTATRTIRFADDCAKANAA
eukprot:Nk52_evm26s160 gene=Nk52_evmTU26s160